MANLIQHGGGVERSPRELWLSGVARPVRWTLLLAAAALTLALMIRYVSPAVVALLMEVARPSYFGVEAAYLLPMVACLGLLSLCGAAASVGRVRDLLGWALVALAFATILAVLALNPDADFTTEAGKITTFTTTALVLCSIASAASYAVTARAQRLSRLFWGALALAFLFAAADEALMIHERLGDIASWLLGVESEAEANRVQDDVTVTYALAALAFLGGAAASVQATRLNRRSLAWLAIAALVYFASTLLDSLNAGIRSAPLAIVDAGHMANTVEEMLEFMAAMLLLFGCLLGLLEHRAAARWVATTEDRMAHWPARALRAAAAGGLGLFLLAALALPALGLGRAPGLVAEGLGARLVSGPEQAPLHPDGLASGGGRIYVVSDHPASLARVHRGGGVEVTALPYEPESVAVAPDGRVFFSDEGRGEVYEVIGELAPILLLDRSDGLRAPKGLAVSPQGELFIADAGASAIFRYRGSGLSIFASSLDGVWTPEEIAFDANGDLYVTEDQKRVQKLTPDGRMTTFLAPRAGFTPEGIAIAGDRIVITDSGQGAVLEYRRDGGGRVLATLPPRLGRALEGVTITPDGAVWVGLRPPMDIPGALLRIAPPPTTSRRAAP